MILEDGIEVETEDKDRKVLSSRSHSDRSQVIKENMGLQKFEIFDAFKAFKARVEKE